MVTTKKTSKKDKIAILEAELKRTQFELDKAKEELSRKNYDEFYEESYRFYMTRYGQALMQIEELEKENKTLKGALKALEAFANSLKYKQDNGKTTEN